ncbi:MAG: TlpA family protein disulfide reductase [Gammaproteobacteria bacterium]|nr:TlpA family protein disulfide reductase [Gammaproteobacteria bacterium]
MKRHFLLLLCLMIASLSVYARGYIKKIDPPQTPPGFTLMDLDGEPHQLSDYLGSTVIVSFWASWCPPCRKEMPSMERAWQRLKGQGVQFLAVNVGENEETVFLFTADYDISFPLLLDLDGKITEQWPVQGLPTTFVLNPAGKIVYQAVGGREWDEPELLKLIRSLKP